MRFGSIFSFFVMVIVCASFATAYERAGTIGLLTVSESNNTETGGVASLSLTITEGSGRIFIDSFPLSKIDTLITTRFAAELACDFLDTDCSHYDFFYTIRASSSLVGGPSAGAAATVLTAALLDDQPLDNKTIMTGTINSGYLVGPVAGIAEKAYAAQLNGYARVLIPTWDDTNFSASNHTYTIDIVHVSTLEDALYSFTGKNYTQTYPEAKPTAAYLEIMRNVTLDICSRYGALKNDRLYLPNITQYIPGYVFEKEDDESEDSRDADSSNSSANASIADGSEDNRTRGRDFFGKALIAINNQEYYSAASHCFGGNVRIATELANNLSTRDKKIAYAKLLGEISAFEESVDARNLTTIPSLETYMVVKERLHDAKSVLRKQNPENLSGVNVAYARERFYTAKVWAEFFKLDGEQYIVDEQTLGEACIKKISEAEERFNYLQIYTLGNNREDIERAYDYRTQGEYPLCIFTAAKAKADADVILSALFVDRSKIDSLYDEKIRAANHALARQISHDLFPILGYSYYSYAKNLKSVDTYSSLIYAEYALELSNLDMYFPKEAAQSRLSRAATVDFDRFVFGFIAGMFIVILVITMYGFYLNVQKSEKSRKHRR